MTSTSPNPNDRRPLWHRSLGWIQAMAAGLARAGVSPNAISVSGLIAAILAGCAWAATGVFPEPRALWLIGFALVVLRILANTFDGMVAVEWGRASKVGLLYNEAPDRLSDCALMIGAGYASGGSVELGWAAACIALFVSYARVLGRVADAPMDFCGPMDKGGRMIVLMLAALWLGLAPASWQPSVGQWGLPALALLLICVGGAFTAARRLLRAGRHLRRG
jgi:phosphatidylglycerophosphate synthase